MRLAFLPLALVALATSGTAFGACLLHDYSVRAEYARSAAVVVAKVVSDGKVPSFEPSDAVWGVTYTLKIKESFRGSLPKTVEVFSENSSLPDLMDTLTASVQSQGQTVIVAGSLYSDALGRLDSEASTYLGMMRYNVDSIVTGLLGLPAE